MKKYSSHASSNVFCWILSGLLFLGVNGSQASDQYWKPDVDSGNLNSDDNWNDYAPGSSDTAVFSDAEFDSTSLSLTVSDFTTQGARFENASEGKLGSYDISLGSGNTWNITDTLDVHLKSGATWSLASGTVNVTNAQENATATFGSHPDEGDTTYGSLSLDGSTAYLKVDQLNITGASGGWNGGLYFVEGQLDILHGSLIKQTASGVETAVATSSGKTAYLNYLGGENVIQSPGSVSFGSAGTAEVVVSGSDTTLDFNILEHGCPVHKSHSISWLEF